VWHGYGEPRGMWRCRTCLIDCWAEEWCGESAALEPTPSDPSHGMGSLMLETPDFGRRPDDDTGEFPTLGATLATTILDQLEAEYRALCQRAKTAGLWDQFWAMVYRVSKSFGPIVIPPPVIQPPPGGYPIPLIPQRRDSEGERAD
jgi:hypothetical protein